MSSAVLKRSGFSKPGALDKDEEMAYEERPEAPKHDIVAEKFGLPYVISHTWPWFVNSKGRKLYVDRYHLKSNVAVDFHEHENIVEIEERRRLCEENGVVYTYNGPRRTLSDMVKDVQNSEVL